MADTGKLQISARAAPADNKTKVSQMVSSVISTAMYTVVVVTGFVSVLKLGMR